MPGPGYVPMLIAVSTRSMAQQSALEPGGVQASHILDLWHVTLAVCVIVFGLVLAGLIVAILRAPRADRGAAPDLSSLTRPETGPRRAVVWATVVSGVVLSGLVLADVFTERALSRLPLAGAVRIEMIGHQWWWEIRYQEDGGKPGFVTANELHVPVGRPVILSLKSADVIHTFWVPGLHGKKDMIPGRGATIEFRADRAGEYRGQCAEFCGAAHALMAFSVVAEPPPQYQAWAAAQRQPAFTPADPDVLVKQGKEVMFSKACAQCHTIRGTAANGALGPDLTHFAGRTTLAAGTAPNNPDLLRRWLADPNALKPGTTMPALPLTAADLQALTAYLETHK
jgi:cytochrome c oxidase subunit 2